MSSFDRVNAFLSGYVSALGIARIAFFGIAVVLAVVCALDWAVRTRRLNPFGPIARFIRSTVDPLIRPIEGRVVRAGGLPQSAPWWTLAAVVLAGIVVLSLLDFLGGQLVGIAMAINAGPRGILIAAITLAAGVLNIALLVRVLSSWVSVSPYSPWIRWSFVLTEWLIAPLRRIIPTLGPIDVSPIAAYFLVSITARVIVGALA